MAKSNAQPIVGARAVLVKNPLIVDGITRAGKFLLTNMLSGIAGVEPAQYRPVMEHIARLTRFGFIDAKAAQELLRAEADAACYDMLIGRNFNCRRSDKSSIYNKANYKAYLKRLQNPGGPGALSDFYEKKLLSTFIIHEAFPNIRTFFNAFPSMKAIVVQRSPVDLVYSWQQRKLVHRIGTDPLMGEIPLAGKKGSIPWYLYNHQEEYASLSGIDRTILAICTLFNMYDQTYRKLPPKDKKRTIFIHYEDFILNPESEVKTISQFLKRKMLPELKRVIKKEKLPNKKRIGLKEGKAEEIQAAASKRYFNRLMSLEKKYSGSMYDKTTNSR